MDRDILQEPGGGAVSGPAVGEAAAADAVRGLDLHNRRRTVGRDSDGGLHGVAQLGGIQGAGGFLVVILGVFQELLGGSDKTVSWTPA